MTRREELTEWLRAFGAVTLKAKDFTDSDKAADFLNSLGLDVITMAATVESDQTIPMADIEADYITLRDT